MAVPVDVVVLPSWSLVWSGAPAMALMASRPAMASGLPLFAAATSDAAACSQFCTASSCEAKPLSFSCGSNRVLTE